jgi:cellulose synthase/poly-beta-1,6-N-acetylglucosamine synthase-like glycosyltransferase
MDYSIVIPAYQAAAVLPHCLRALEHQSIDPARYEVIVVDDGSSDGTAAVAEQHMPALQLRVIRLSHQGPAQARNTGGQMAQGDLLLFTDADCEPAPDWIERLTKVFADPEISGVKGSYRTRQRSLMARFVQQEYEDRYDRMRLLSAIDFIDTYSAAYRRDVFLNMGGFDTAFPTASVEDQELSFRLAAQGHRLVFAPDAVVYHRHNATVDRYFKRKYKIGYWKAFLLRQHPGKAIRDTHTPQIVKVQMALLAAALVSLCGVAFGPIGRGVAIGWWVLLFLTMLPLLRKIARRDPMVLLVAPLLIGVRALALGLGLGIGLLRFHLFTPSASKL